jgi:hypothetical protein
MNSQTEQRREYFRKYYREHVDLEAERVRKQKFYELHREEILAKAKLKYAAKKTAALNNMNNMNNMSNDINEAG